MNASLPMPSFASRLLHQMRVELRRDRGPLLMWLLLLAIYAWERTDIEHSGFRGYVPGMLPTAAGLFLLWRMVRADHPGSSDCAVLTRPLGRGALWMAKMLTLMLLGVLPWFAAHAVEWMGFGLGAVSWFGVALKILLPACAGAFAFAWVACLPMKRGAWLLLLPILLVLLVLELPNWTDLGSIYLASAYGDMEKLFAPNDLNRCRAVVAAALAVLVFGFGWWRGTMGKRSAGLVVGLLVLSGLVALFWPWNWRQLDAAIYPQDAVRLHFGAAPAVEHQSLWPQLHLSGLAADEVASVVAFAPIRSGEEKWPQTKSYSDFVYSSENGGTARHWRWMRVDHAMKLSEFFPPQSMWVGDVDDSRTKLSQLVARENKRSPVPPGSRWRLRLSVHRLRKCHEWPLKDLLQHPTQAAAAPGWMFVIGKHRAGQSSLSLDASLHRRVPLTVANSDHAALRVQTMVPVENLFFTLHTPSISQVVCLHEEEAFGQEHNTLWRAEHRHRPVNLHIPRPVIHETLTGLTTEDWIHESTAALWWADERGTLDLEVTAEQIDQLLAGTNQATKP